LPLPIGFRFWHLDSRRFHKREMNVCVDGVARQRVEYLQLLRRKDFHCGALHWFVITLQMFVEPTHHG
jgi:hypothetical protein